MENYTSEQLATMTQEQLTGIILQAQAETVVKSDNKEAIDQVKTVITNLETIGAELFESEITALKGKLATLEAQAIETVKEELQKAETEAVSFYDKYRTEIIVVAAIVLVHLLGKVGF
ncbi:hypothetical protein [Pelosinus sp. IPA-1]|uniref:hypothetical protein n=1 Tax=Pelosinus sp. IPA-1 TaxID=3029569 RepID=UPI0024362AB3|nr:hypothetical protein [Pelosinus sp. IPA-1]GMB00453.1 hypothetical protein PIPA1_32520 [Pelosinus sp. IPA-1]